MDVVGNDGEGRVGSGFHGAGRARDASLSGSISIACRLLQENTSCAASRQGSHRKRRCSFGASVTSRRSRNPQPEDMLGIVRDAGRVAVAPDRVDLVDVRHLPIGELVVRRIDPRLLADFANGGLDEALARFLASGDALPEARMIRSLDEEHVEFRRVDRQRASKPGS